MTLCVEGYIAEARGDERVTLDQQLLITENGASCSRRFRSRPPCSTPA
jgi:hypothetical protein